MIKAINVGLNTIITFVFIQICAIKRKFSLGLFYLQSNKYCFYGKISCKKMSEKLCMLLYTCVILSWKFNTIIQVVTKYWIPILCRDITNEFENLFLLPRTIILKCRVKCILYFTLIIIVKLLSCHLIFY